MKTTHSRILFDRALQLLPGGVDSPVRAFRAVGGDPLFIDRGHGPYLYDVDGHRFVDYVLSWGPLILGHAHPAVVHAISDAAHRGTSFGAPSALEVELASLVCDAFPTVELVRFVNSGTEATMSALRLARAFTGRPKIIKFEGCYHGHVDALLVQAGSGVATLGLPDSPGIPTGATADTLVAPYNDRDAVERLFAEFPDQIAGVIVEPVAGNMGVVPPADGFLRGLRHLTRSNGALLIFDEVMTGFRVHPNGAQGLYRIEPDLTTLGKVIGGGLPVGAYGGRRDIMALVAPSGPVYQAGTLSGNPLAMAAGIATLTELAKPGIWDGIEARTADAASAFEEAATTAGVSIALNRVGTMFSAFFAEGPITDWSAVQGADTEAYRRFFQGMLERGIYLAPSAFEAAFLSAAHGDDEIARTADAAARTFAAWE